MTDVTTHPGYEPDVHDTADRIVRRYPVARSALLPLLHLVQSVDNHITDAGVAFCAEKVGLTRAEVGAVATFYTMYKREPVGDWLLSVCTNPVCKQAGGGEIYENYKTALGGHSDADTKVTVEHAECLGICDGAPVVQVNYEMFGPMTVAEGDQLLASCRSGNPPVSPWSGEKPPTFNEVERDLSGANDAWEAELHKAALQQIAFADPPTYRTGETDIPVTHPGGDPAGVGGAAFRMASAGGTVVAEVTDELEVQDVVDAPAADGEQPAEATGDEPGYGEDPTRDASDAAGGVDEGEPGAIEAPESDGAQADDHAEDDEPVNPGEFAEAVDAGDHDDDEDGATPLVDHGADSETGTPDGDASPAAPQTEA